jgi:hypothetical protein
MATYWINCRLCFNDFEISKSIYEKISYKGVLMSCTKCGCGHHYMLSDIFFHHEEEAEEVEEEKEENKVKVEKKRKEKEKDERLSIDSEEYFMQVKCSEKFCFTRNAVSDLAENVSTDRFANVCLCLIKKEGDEKEEGKKMKKVFVSSSVLMMKSDHFKLFQKEEWFKKEIKQDEKKEEKEWIKKEIKIEANNWMTLKVLVNYFYCPHILSHFIDNVYIGGNNLDEEQSIEDGFFKTSDREWCNVVLELLEFSSLFELREMEDIILNRIINILKPYYGSNEIHINTYRRIHYIATLFFPYIEMKSSLQKRNQINFFSQKKLNECITHRKDRLYRNFSKNEEEHVLIEYHLLFDLILNMIVGPATHFGLKQNELCSFYLPSGITSKDIPILKGDEEEEEKVFNMYEFLEKNITVYTIETMFENYFNEINCTDCLQQLERSKHKTYSIDCCFHFLICYLKNLFDESKENNEQLKKDSKPVMKLLKEIDTELEKRGNERVLRGSRLDFKNLVKSYKWPFVNIEKALFELVITILSLHRMKMIKEREEKLKRELEKPKQVEEREEKKWPNKKQKRETNDTKRLVETINKIFDDDEVCLT